MSQADWDGFAFAFINNDDELDCCCASERKDLAADPVNGRFRADAVARADAAEF
jgi:hypothetical protein